MQDVYILSPVSGLYSTRSDIADSDDVDYFDPVHGIHDDDGDDDDGDDDDDDSVPIQRGSGSHVM